MKFRNLQQNISWTVNTNMQMNELIMSSPHFFPHILYVNFWILFCFVLFAKTCWNISEQTLFCIYFEIIVNSLHDYCCFDVHVNYLINKKKSFESEKNNIILHLFSVDIRQVYFLIAEIWDLFLFYLFVYMPIIKARCWEIN